MKELRFIIGQNFIELSGIRIRKLKPLDPYQDLDLFRKYLSFNARPVFPGEPVLDSANHDNSGIKQRCRAKISFPNMFGFLLLISYNQDNIRK